MTIAALGPDFAAFETDEDMLAKATQLRTQFVERFPVEDIKKLTLAQYALGTDDNDSFCNWLEFKTSAVGSIRGAPAPKHVVFYTKRTMLGYTRANLLQRMRL